ncbi:hypothetical protein LY474_30460 [Myxococcus stipitatus]|uniref:hypothetical protein n=1 Tax=Myxococcus stipitatus TaxID=83455 RepID=UPI001F48ED13|nr:hypothetical protein [Myxococcus stipitatus]MCE9672138.1 hypothetical protein [Myxococcus stipitatus]
MLCLTLSAGCGPGGGESGLSAEEIDAPKALPPEYLGEEGGPGQVEGNTICCNVKCSGTWYGPFPKVVYDHCAAYGRYYCPQRSLKYQDSRWKNC